MNEEQETLVRQSRWNGRRVVLLYWFAIVFMGTAAASGLAADILNPRYSFDSTSQTNHGGVDPTQPWGPSDCATCHQDKVDSWNDTLHAQSGTWNGSHWLVGDRNDPHAYDATAYDCMIACHTTRYNATNTASLPGESSVGALSGTYWNDTVYNQQGVQCASCHEVPGVVTHDDEICGQCHTHGGQYQDYNASAHAVSMEDLIAGGFVADYCIHCHSGLATLEGEEVDATDPSIYCATCHNPHDATNLHQIREPTVVDLCGTCHTDSKEMITTGPHAEVIEEEGCATCHGYQEYAPYYAPTSIRTRVNHTWEVNLDWNGTYDISCEQCHSGPAAQIFVEKAEEIQTDIETLMGMVEAQIDNATDKWEEANATTGVDMALVNDSWDLIEEAEDLFGMVEHDSSHGFHNPELADESLKLALFKLNEAYEKAVEAIEGPSGGPTPGFGFFSVLAGFSILAVGLVLLRKRRT